MPKLADIVTVGEAAIRLGVSEEQVRALINSGKLAAHKIARDWIIQEAPPENILSVKQAATELGVSCERVRALIHDGKLAAVKIGRDWAIRQEALHAAKTASRPRKRPNNQGGRPRRVPNK